MPHFRNACLRSTLAMSNLTQKRIYYFLIFLLVIQIGALMRSVLEVME